MAQKVAVVETPQKVKLIQKIPWNVVLAVFIFIIPLLLLKEEKLEINQKILGLQSQVKAEQMKAFEWEQILLQKPDYRDGWLQLAVIYYKLGDKEKAKSSFERAKALDPLNETVTSLEKIFQD